MNRLETGMVVMGIRGRRVGVVGEICNDCFEVARPKHDGDAICLKPEAIFTVDSSGVTLVCSNEDIERYRCLEHTHAATNKGPHSASHESG